jgi:hypothetical protein
MLTVIYASTAEHPFSGQELIELLHEARRNNAQHHITGLLLYKDGEFMQCLEGEAMKVLRLMDNITHDPRHTNVAVLMCMPIEERRFLAWSMGFVHLDELKSDSPDASMALMEKPLKSEVFEREPEAARNLLYSLKGSLR